MLAAGYFLRAFSPKPHKFLRRQPPPRDLPRVVCPKVVPDERPDPATGAPGDPGDSGKDPEVGGAGQAQFQAQQAAGGEVPPVEVPRLP